ncbi:MAG: GxxExxY protein [Owenweeksia sp.]|nr:GxxExxY protein [Owenweeksia sp.]
MAESNEAFLFEQETYQVIGACMAVHRELGAGFLEPVYQEALALEFLEAKIPFDKEKRLEISYKGNVLNKCYYADFVCFDRIISEWKAVEGLIDEHKAQLINYFKSNSIQYK